jgi:transposase InsO family protein
MSRIGSPCDDAEAESFMKTLEQEEVDGRAYRHADEARNAIGAFIENVYNRQRLRSALAYVSPAEFEATLRPRIAVGAPPGRELHAVEDPGKSMPLVLGAPA